MEKPDQVEEERSSINERQMENLDQAAEERRSSSNKRQYAQWKMETLSAQVPMHVPFKYWGWTLFGRASLTMSKHPK